jgi:hypothetical protein
MKKNKNRKDEVKFANSRTSHCTMSVSSVSFCTERIMLGNRSKERFVEMSRWVCLYLLWIWNKKYCWIEIFYELFLISLLYVSVVHPIYNLKRSNTKLISNANSYDACPCYVWISIHCWRTQVSLGRSNREEWGGQDKWHGRERREKCTRFWWESPKERDHLFNSRILSMQTISDKRT